METPRVSAVVSNYLVLEGAIKQWIEMLLNIKLKMEYWKELRDGVIICKIIQAFQPRLIPTICEPGSQYNIKQNIMFFIDACRQMGIEKAAIFEYFDLNSMRNIPKVICCLEQVAMTFEKEGDYDGPIFSNLLKAALQNETQPSCSPERIDKIQPLLQRLCQYFNEKNVPNSTLTTTGSLVAAVVDSDVSRWESSAKSVRNRRKSASEGGHRRRLSVSFDGSLYVSTIPQIVLLQSWIRLRRQQRKYDLIRRDETYRQYVAKEIFQTEQEYVYNLSTLIEVFLFPLKESQHVLTVNYIYAEVEVIQAFSKLLLADLGPRIKDWSVRQCLGDVILSVTEYMKVYTQFVKDYSLFIEQLVIAKKDSGFRDVLRKCESNTGRTKNLPFESFLILPVQRIPRYELLVRDLIKRTREDHPDFQNLTSCLVKIKEVASYVNEQKREFENMLKVLEVQSNFTGKYENFAEPHRRFVKEGDCVENNRERHLVLFNDVLVISKPHTSLVHDLTFSRKKKARYVIKKVLDLEGLVIEPFDEGAESGFVVRKESKVFKFYCLSSDRPSWLDGFHVSQKKLKESNRLLPTKYDSDDEDQPSSSSSSSSSSSAPPLTNDEMIDSFNNQNNELLQTLMREAASVKEASTAKADARRFITLGDKEKAPAHIETNRQLMKMMSVSIAPGQDPRKILQMFKNTETVSLVPSPRSSPQSSSSDLESWAHKEESIISEEKPEIPSLSIPSPPTSPPNSPPITSPHSPSAPGSASRNSLSGIFKGRRKSFTTDSTIFDEEADKKKNNKKKGKTSKLKRISKLFSKTEIEEEFNSQEDPNNTSSSSNLMVPIPVPGPPRSISPRNSSFSSSPRSSSPLSQHHTPSSSSSSSSSPSTSSSEVPVYSSPVPGPPKSNSPLPVQTGVYSIPVPGPPRPSNPAFSPPVRSPSVVFSPDSGRSSGSSNSSGESVAITDAINEREVIHKKNIPAPPPRRRDRSRSCGSSEDCNL